MLRHFACLIALATLPVAPAAAQSLKADEIVSSIAVAAINPPIPVPGADGRVHLAYELHIDNNSRLFVTPNRIEAVDADGKVLGMLDGDALTAMMTSFSGKPPLIPPGGTATVFMDVSFAEGEALPDMVYARVTATREMADGKGNPVPLGKDQPVPATYTFTGAPTPVSGKAVVVAPPLKGKHWVAVNGCCDTVTSHRGEIMPVNGQMRLPERFAIDWVKLDDKGQVFTGGADQLSSYAYYGTEVLSVADGTVVNLYNEADEQVPGEDPKGITTENIGGNMIVVDIGNGAFAFYAHLQRDSLKVKLGDTVKTGQPLALLGNTGNSTGPHLHFHVMDGPSPLDANGLPFTFTGFTGEGVLVAQDEAMEEGKPVKPDTTRLTGKMQTRLPLNNQVVTFD